jgi:hypothetical protein
MQFPDFSSPSSTFSTPRIQQVWDPLVRQYLADESQAAYDGLVAELKKYQTRFTRDPSDFSAFQDRLYLAVFKRLKDQYNQQLEQDVRGGQKSSRITRLETLIRLPQQYVSTRWLERYFPDFTTGPQRAAGLKPKATPDPGDERRVKFSRPAKSQDHPETVLDPATVKDGRFQAVETASLAPTAYEFSQLLLWSPDDSDQDQNRLVKEVLDTMRKLVSRQDGVVKDQVLLLRQQAQFWSAEFFHDVVRPCNFKNLNQLQQQTPQVHLVLVPLIKLVWILNKNIKLSPVGEEMDRSRRETVESALDLRRQPVMTRTQWREFQALVFPVPSNPETQEQLDWVEYYFIQGGRTTPPSKPSLKVIEKLEDAGGLAPMDISE